MSVISGWINCLHITKAIQGKQLSSYVTKAIQGRQPSDSNIRAYFISSFVCLC